ncbi:synphilin-1-like [Carassius carassius]|uniref:synphilin-1-like n=1 Tax=Carassius carassius TaxID=217509 RepID=UPI0028684ED3|nr:synphilin-1-like [Carassius carassius]
MDVPEYLDLDEIDFTDDLPFKSIPELCRRHDGANDERQAPSISWARSAASHGAGIKPTGIADVYSKLRPVKRVSPLKHQPQETEPESEGKSGELTAEISKDKSRDLLMLGELEHYDLDMDEILDVPYIKSGQQTSSLPREKRSALTHSESMSHGTHFCVLSPVSWPHIRKSKSVDQDYLRTQSAHGSEPDLNQPDMLPLQPAKAPKQDKPWRTFGEADEEAKKTQNILNIVREGQISLLPHLAAENLERIRDEDENNLLHVSAAQGHTDCLQHLTSLMGEDCLTERNTQQLTPAGLAVRNGHLECVRWMVSETEAIAELSCTREHPSLIHYAARHGQERVLLWLLQFMQEQGISLDEADQNGNTAVHVAAQFGHLSCIQTLVEYGSNVTVQNEQGERASQNAERQGHSTCSRYLVVVETCMSLASQVVKLTKQLQEQSTARVALQNQLQPLQTHRPPSPSSWTEMNLTDEAASDGKEAEPGAGPGAGPMKRLGPGERRELKQIMQRSLSESDGDAVYPADESKQPRPERPTQLPIKLNVSFTHRTSRTVNVYNPSPSSDQSDPETKTELTGEIPDGQKLTTSPKSALKSPSSRRKTSQSLRLRVTFDEPPRKDGPAPDARVQPGKDKPESSRWAFGTLRSFMETLSGNQNNNNNSAAKHAGTSGKKSKSKTSSV